MGYQWVRGRKTKGIGIAQPATVPAALRSILTPKLISAECHRCKGKGMLVRIDGRPLVTARQALGLTRVEVAKTVGISPSYLLAIEINERNPTEELYRKIAEAIVSRKEHEH